MSGVPVTPQVLASHCVTAAGVGTAAALGALHAGMGATARHPEFALPSPSGTPAPIHYAPVLDAAQSERIPALLGQLLETMPEPGPSAVDAAWLVLPGAVELRSERLPVADLAASVEETLACPCHAVSTDEGVTPVLSTITAAMAADGLERVWLIGVDSLIDPDMLLALDQVLPLRRSGTDGLVPGEAAAAVLLAPRPPGSEISAITAWASAPEPSPGRAGEVVLEGLRTAIGAALAQARQPADRVRALYSDDAGDPPAQLEWTQCAERIWPASLPDDQRHAMELGLVESVNVPDVRPSVFRWARIAGMTGTAGLPLHLGLATEWRRWQRQWAAFGVDEPAAVMLICEQYSSGYRYALVIA